MTEQPATLGNPEDFPWDEVSNLEKFREDIWTYRLTDGLRTIPSTEAARLLKGPCATAVERLIGVKQRLCEQFVRKNSIIHMAIVCAIAQQPMLLVGQPGTAKSKIITRLCELLGVTRAHGSGSILFQYLLHAFTEPDELLGVVDLRLLRRQSKFERIREGSLTEASFVFLDEVFKANSAILNALLSIINERYVYEGGHAHAAQCRQIYGASNHTPTPRQMEDLRAFYERFIIRMQSDALAEKADIKRLLDKGWESELKDLRSGYRPNEAALVPVSCLNDLVLCNRAAAEFWGGEDLTVPDIGGFMSHFLNLVDLLKSETAKQSQPLWRIDDRKVIRLFLLTRAHALLPDPAPKDWASWEPVPPALRDLAVFRHIWEDPEGAVILRRNVDNFINGGGLGERESSSIGAGE